MYCESCKHQGTKVCKSCSSSQGVPDWYIAKPKAIADKIRALTDEELLRFARELLAQLVEGRGKI